jgi:sodium transport system permease protein
VNHVAHIYRKELREMLRDKRVLSSAVVGPVFMIVLFLMLFGFLQDTLTKPRAQTLHVLDTPAGHNFADNALSSGPFRIVYVPTRERGEALLREGKARALLEVPEDFSSTIQEGRPAKLKVTFDPDEAKAPLTVGALEKMVSIASKSHLEGILEASGVNPEMADPYVLERVELKKEKALAGTMIIGLLPYLIVIWAFYGGFSIVTDLAAGEKEKNTLETLLISPAKRSHIALGKFFALGTVCLASSLTSLLGVVVVGSLNLPITKGLFPNGVNVSPIGLLALMGALLPLVAFFAGVLLAISAYARNTREAQTHLTIMSFIVLMPAVFSQFIGYTDFARERWVSLVPILNSAGVIRESLLGKFDGVGVLLTMASSILLALAALWITVRLFEREEVLAKL